MNQSLVSVIITNYNYADYLPEAIDSVLNQSYQNFELIIVDDGSKDKSLTSLKEYETKFPDKIRVIYKENGGQGSAFNTGFEVATGDIVAFLDADDYWYENKLEVIAHYHKKYEGIQHNLLINDGIKYTMLENKVAKQKKGLEKYGFLGLIPTSGMSFTKEAIKNIFPVPEQDYRICVDFYVKLMFLNEHEMLSIDTPLGCYRAHDTNEWFNSKESAKEYNEKSLGKLNKIRGEQGKKQIPEKSGAESYGLFMLDGLALDKGKKYVLYGTGKLAEVFYQKLKEDYQIIYFTSSFAVGGKDTFLAKYVKTVDYLIEHSSEYDQIIIASTQLSEITSYLIEKGFSQDKFIIPRL